MIRHSAPPGPLALRLESFLSRKGWLIRPARWLGFRPKVRIVEHTIPLAPTVVPLSDLRVVFASDFHAGATTDPEVLHAAAAKLRSTQPDVVLYGGDFISVHPREMDWLAPLLGSIPVRYGRFAVLGNHDRWVDAEYVTRSLENSGITVLVNRNIRLPAPHDNVWICGLDDVWSGRPDIQLTMAGAEGVRVLLMHSPSALVHVGDERFELALCGHTHGGQIALPGGIPVLLPSGPLSRRYARGRFTLGAHRTLIVSVGLGCSLLPIRIHSDPEVLQCRFAADGSDRS